jgi:hypothetical protein
MGSYYTLGIIRKFTATATKGKNLHWLDSENVPLERGEWIKLLSERIDPYLFELEVQDDGSIRGFLKNEIFQEHTMAFMMFSVIFLVKIEMKILSITKKNIANTIRTFMAKMALYTTTTR